MNQLRKIFRFLGSLYFAIILILVTALFVLTGTFIESITASHLYAAYFTYHSMAFNFLLCGFFVNIFTSTWRRWPFRLKHVPFIITHLGLLMILGGVLLKNFYGRQGSMSLMEGTGQDEILLPNTFAISVEKKITDLKIEKKLIPFNLSNPATMQKSFEVTSFPDLKMEIVGYYPHAKEILETWIKGNTCIISGLPPFPCQKFENDKDNLSYSLKVQFFPPPALPWNILAIKTKDPLSAFKSIYSEAFIIRLINPITQQVLIEKKLKEVLETPIITPLGSAKIQLKMTFSPLTGLKDPYIEVFLTTPCEKCYRVLVYLSGLESLENVNATSPFLGEAYVKVELEGYPTLSLIENDLLDVYLFAFDSFGRIHSETFRNETLNQFVVYDQGFMGYSVSADLPFAEKAFSREDLENKKREKIKSDLQQLLNNSTPLVLPLELMKPSGEKYGLDMAEYCLQFLEEWHKRHTLLLPNICSLEPTMEIFLKSLDWIKVTPEIKKGCCWIAFIFEELEQQLKSREDLFTCLKTMNWPLLNDLKPNDALENEYEKTQDLINRLVQQIFYISSYLPDLPLYEISKGRLLSSLFLLYGIHLSYISPLPTDPVVPLKIESPISFHFQPQGPSSKLEENTPLIRIKFIENERHEEILLRLDRFLSGFRQPILDGKYLVRLQPYFEPIPYRIRLRQARQINYPDSSQPYSYESDIIIIDKKNGSSQETTLSMNHVYETWDGYRFYLANIVPSDSGSVKKIQIVVNLDPVKYVLTYPGGLILVMGIFFLFWFRQKTTLKT